MKTRRWRAGIVGKLKPKKKRKTIMKQEVYERAVVPQERPRSRAKSGAGKPTGDQAEMMKNMSSRCSTRAGEKTRRPWRSLIHAGRRCHIFVAAGVPFGGKG